MNNGGALVLLSSFCIRGLIHLFDCSGRYVDDMLISSSPVPSPSPSLSLNMIHRAGRLPVPQLGIMHDVRDAIKSLQRGGHLRERICEFIRAEVSESSLVRHSAVYLMYAIGLYQGYDRRHDSS